MPSAGTSDVARYQREAPQTKMLSADESRRDQFQDLPDELLLNIIEQLSPRRGPCDETHDAGQSDNEEKAKALHALTLTCRRFNVITTPTLYACILRGHCQPRSIKLLLRTLTTEPRFSQHIQYIEGFTGLYGNDDSIFSPEDLEEYDRCLANAAWIVPYNTLIAENQMNSSHTRNPSILYFGKTLATIREGHAPWFAITALIALAPNLQEAFVHYHPIFRATLAFKHYSPSGGGLRRVWFVGYGSPSQKIMYMLKADNCQKGSNIAQCLLSYEEDKNSYVKAPPLYAASVDACDMSLDYDLPQILNCGALKRFSARWKDADMDEISRHGPMHPVDLPKLRSLLTRFETSLTHIEIDTMECSWKVHLDMDIEAFGSFKEFTSLTHLTVTGLVLWGDYEDDEYPRLSEILPESLEVLCIKTEWDEDVEDGLYNLAEDCSSSFPLLKQVTCVWRPAPRSIGESLIQTFQDLGIELFLEITDAQEPEPWRTQTQSSDISISGD